MADKYTVDQVKSISPKVLLKLIQKAKNYLKRDPVMIRIFNQYDIDIAEMDMVPIAFADLDVSARTAHGIIFLNYKLLCDGDFFKDYSYLIHETTHWAQQTSGDAATRGSTDGEYLENPVEIEGFQNQIEWIANELGEEEADEYADQVTEHHDLEGKEKRDKESELKANV